MNQIEKNKLKNPKSLRGQTHNLVKIKYKFTRFIKSLFFRLNQC